MGLALALAHCAGACARLYLLKTKEAEAENAILLRYGLRAMGLLGMMYDE